MCSPSLSPSQGKFTQTLVLALVVGLIFLQVGDDQAGIQDRTGSLFFVVVQVRCGG